MSGSGIDRTTVVHVAKLAALSLGEKELERLAMELAAIVGHVTELARVDTTGVEPTTRIEFDRAAWRPDEARPCLPREEALRAAPRIEDDAFVVPAFVEER